MYSMMREGDPRAVGATSGRTERGESCGAESWPLDLDHRASPEA